MFLKHLPKQFIIGKSMSLQDHMNGICGRDEITINKRKPVFILIFQKRNPHLFLKKTTEISGLEISDTCDLIQGNGPLIIFRNIIQYKVQPIQIFFLLA